MTSNEHLDFSKAVEIAKDIYWVGYVIPDDPFQCHVYLIKNGKESILIDPGSMITFPVTLQKISSIIPIEDIKYIVLHHQDPDIVGCVSTLEKLIPRKDKFFITHWRTHTLLKHYQWETPFWLIDQHDWRLSLANGRVLEFVFTPYAHFAGAFCTYDNLTGTLFSSDIFGGLTDEFSLFANDASYFESLKIFHIHYIPSKLILNHALDNIQKYDPKMIAPQHGSIIKEELIAPIIEQMRRLDCGLYMLDDKESDIVLLSKTDNILQKFFEDILSVSSFEMVLRNLFDYIRNDIADLKSMRIYQTQGDEHKLLYAISPQSIESGDGEESVSEEGKCFSKFLEHNNERIGEIKLIFSAIDAREEHLLDIFLNKILIPFTIGFKKEINFEDMREKAITDDLTSLYNRAYLHQAMQQEIDIAKRQSTPLSIAIIDIDHFKKINDTYGHVIGDCVLQKLAQLLKEKSRKSDILIRYGGEEILLIMPFADKEGAYKKVESLRKSIEQSHFCNELELTLTVSAGIAQYNGKDDIKTFIEKADKNLYKAKKSGRNRTII